jgi:hypothetical protein
MNVLGHNHRRVQLNALALIVKTMVENQVTANAGNGSGLSLQKVTKIVCRGL